MSEAKLALLQSMPIGAVRAIKEQLRKHWWWCRLQEFNHDTEGRKQAWQRHRMMSKILSTPPQYTSRHGQVEVRVMTWWRDWVSVIWALKSFYHYAEVDYPLYIHDGGLSRGQAKSLLSHFPNATLVSEDESSRSVAELKKRRLARSLAYRNRYIIGRTLWDYYVCSSADYIINIDSDILFFQKPDALIVPPQGYSVNLFNKDSTFGYSMTLDEMEESFGIRPMPYVNGGLGLVRRETIDFDFLEKCLAHPKLFDHGWLTVQTLHALNSAIHGGEHLPESYAVTSGPGLSKETVCKHYVAYSKAMLCNEGVAHLMSQGFLNLLSQSHKTSNSDT